MPARSGLKLVRGLMSRLRLGQKLPPELQAGRDVIAAIDAGGLPLDAARINRIARDLGLDVSPQAPLKQTLPRLRAAVERGLQNLAMQEGAKTHKGEKQ